MNSLLKSLLFVILAGPAIVSAEDAHPLRIVSADGALTEIVYALGEQDHLVGVDTTSGYPVEATELPQIGYKRALSAEGTLSLEPKVLIATEDSGPPAVLDQIKGAGVEMKIFSAESSLKAVEEKIKGVAEVLGKTSEGERLWNKVKASVDQAQARNAVVDQPVKVMFILSMSDRGPIVGGANTHADSIIQLAGAVNAVQDMQGYKPVTSEVIIGLQPDIILMMTRREHTVQADELFAEPGFSETPAAKNKRLVTMDGMLMLGFGPRVGQAIEVLNKAFYPEDLVQR